MFRLGLHLRCTDGIPRRVGVVRSMFIENGLMAMVTNEEGKILDVKWDKDPSEKGFKTLVQLFSKIEKQQNKVPVAIHFDHLVSNWAKAYENMELAEKWLDFRLQQNLTKFEKISLVRGYMKSFISLDPSEFDENKVRQIFERIKDDLDNLDNVTFSGIITPLSLTQRYKDCLGLIEEHYSGPTELSIKKYCYSSIVDGALRNNDVSYAAQIIREYKDLNPDRIDSLWVSVLKHSNKLSVDCMLDLLSLVDNLNPSNKVLMDLQTVIGENAEQWTMFKNPMVINAVWARKTCNTCGENIEPVYFDEEMVEKMKNHIYSLLKKWNGDRFETLLQLLEHQTDISFVIDGMNLFYLFMNEDNSAEWLEEFLSILPGKKLIIGRNIIFQKYQHIFDDQNNIGFPVNYSRDEKSKKASGVDDLFMMYVALHFNPHCQIISEDVMRDHAAKMEDIDLQRFCNRWYNARRMIPRKGYWKENKDFQRPKAVARTTKGWHIEDPSSRSPSVVCVQRRGKHTDI